MPKLRDGDPPVKKAPGAGRATGASCAAPLRRDREWTPGVGSDTVGSCLQPSGNRDGSEAPPGDNGEATREPVTLAGGQFLLRAETVEFRHGDLLAGRYQIEKAIGRGATGTVVQAFDRVVRSVVAVKILRPDLSADERWVERLGGELRYARKLQHRNVCRVFDMGEADGHHFLTMEFAGGGSLRQRLAESPDRTWDQRIADARSVIDGLVAIHAANIVHRDVKPENVLMMDDGRLVVSDFGVAVSAGHTTYFSSKVAGTPSYMAPEVIMGEKATPRADVFSLGIVLHEILFGRRPDWQMTPKGRVLKSPVDRKATKREKAFASICAECLKEYAPDRLADAAEVKRRFELAVEGRLRPLRGRLRERWPLLVGAVAVAASVGIVMMRGRQVDKTLTDPGVASIVGKAVDLSAISRPVFTSDKAFRCFDMLPGRRVARLFWNRPASAIDVDLVTGEQSAAPLVPEAFQAGCPQLSPDGRRLLYVKDDENKRSQIMLSQHPDGRDGMLVTEGSSPEWFPSGDEFAYAFDGRRAAAFSLPKTRLLFPDSPPFERQLQSIAVNDSGDKVALLFVDSKRRASVEIYSYPSMKLLQKAQTGSFVAGMQFDSSRQSLLLSVPDPRYMAVAELDPDGNLVRIGQVKSANVIGTSRTELGLAILTSSFSRSILIRTAGTPEEVFASSGSGRAEMAVDRSALFDKRLEDGRVVVAYRNGRTGAPRAITEGPTDLFPSFGPDGKSFVYVQVGAGTIVSCDLSSVGATNCRPAYTDALGPRFTTVSPDGQLVAYQTTHGSASRLRVLALASGTMRDLGIYRSTCPPAWSSSQGLWLHDPKSSDWREVDASTARPTGQVAESSGDGGAVCDRPPRRAGTAPHFEMRRLETQATQIRIADRF